MTKFLLSIIISFCFSVTSVSSDDLIEFDNKFYLANSYKPYLGQLIDYYKNIELNIAEGIGIGFLLPRTSSSLLNNERYDQFHLSGYGISSVIAINLNYKRYFIQSELKGGFINMSDVRTTNNSADKASQHFFFSQANFLIGVTFRLN